MATLRTKRVVTSVKKPVILQCQDLLFRFQGVTVLGKRALCGDGSYCREAEAGKIKDSTSLPQHSICERSLCKCILTDCGYHLSVAKVN